MSDFKNIDTIIFDLDGTLLDTVDDLKDSVNYAMSSLGYSIKTKEEVRSKVGRGLIKLIEDILPNGLKNPDFNEAVNKFKEYYINIKESKTHPYDNIVELLEELKKRNFKLGVVSNKFDRACKKQCEFFFKGLIDYAQGEDSLNGIVPKPNPVGIYKVMKILNSKNCVFVGDSEVDIQSAINADMPCISVLWGLKTKEFLIQNGGEFFVQNPLEILDMV